MRRRVAGAILLLYPRRVRKGHGPEIVALIEDLVTHEGSSASACSYALRWTGWSSA